MAADGDNLLVESVILILAVLKLVFTTHWNSCGTLRTAKKCSSSSMALSCLAIRLTEAFCLESSEELNLTITVLSSKSSGAEYMKKGQILWVNGKYCNVQYIFIQHTSCGATNQLLIHSEH